MTDPPRYRPSWARSSRRSSASTRGRTRGLTSAWRWRHAATRRAHLAPTSFNPNQLAEIYDFPDADGTGQTIGIIELSSPGGSGFRQKELNTYFKGLGLVAPKVVAVSVDGAMNKPGTDPNDPENADGEVMLDIEVVGAIAPKARIVVYFAPNTAQGFLDVINHAVHDSDHHPTVISMSWGSAENPGDPDANQINQILQAAAAMGVTFCVASGDSGSRDDPSDPDQRDRRLPGLQPVRAGLRRDNARGLGYKNRCRGRLGGPFRRRGQQDLRSSRLPEECRGSSRRQSGGTGSPRRARRRRRRRSRDRVQHPGRRPDSDHRRHQRRGPPVGGSRRADEPEAGPPGRLSQSAPVPEPRRFHDIISGSNTDYNAGPGWDACTGLGSPRGTAILQALSGNGGSSDTSSTRWQDCVTDRAGQ